MTRQRDHLESTATSAGVGLLFGVLLLHPLTMVIYWYEFHPDIAGVTHVAQFVLSRMRAGFLPAMWPMTGLFMIMGGAMGVAVGYTLRIVYRRARQVDQLQAELGRSLASLLASGESETVEFKATARWDHSVGRVNRALELAIVRSVAALMNTRGGSVLIGVDDLGHPCGLTSDLATLRRKNRDGFQQFVIGMIEQHLGTAACRYVHVFFHAVGGHDVCRVLVERAPWPVFLTDQHVARYFVRTGNSTRELDAREALQHVIGESDRHA